MMLHLIKMCVGIDDIEHLRTAQDRRRRLSENPLAHLTRNFPRRAEEILDGGSIYWVIKGFIRVRQRILQLAPTSDAEGTRFCAIHLDPQLVPTRPRAQRAFQGWRYLTAEAAPADQGGAAEGDEMPPEMVEALRELGLL